MPILTEQTIKKLNNMCRAAREESLGTLLAQALGVGEEVLDGEGKPYFAFETALSAVNYLSLKNARTTLDPLLEAKGTDTNIALLARGKGTGAVKLGQATSVGVLLVADQPILDSSANEFVKFAKTANAVNEVTVTNAATGNAPILGATGGDTNIGLKVVGKGTGTVTVGQATGKVAIGTAATDYVGLYGVTPVVCPDHIADAATQSLTGDDTVDKTKTQADLTSCKNAINAILVALENIGLVKAE